MDVYTILTSIILFTIVLYWRFVEENQAALDNEKTISSKKEREIAGEVQKEIISRFKKNLFENVFRNKHSLQMCLVIILIISKLMVKIKFNFTLADVSGKNGDTKSEDSLTNAKHLYSKHFIKIKLH